MAPRSWLKILGYGFLLFVATNILLFIVSMAVGSESTEYPPADHPWAGIVLAILVAICSWGLSRRFNVTTIKQALTLGASWAVMLIVLLLCITIPNQTTSKIFGEWSTYIVFVGAFVGPLLRKHKPTTSSVVL
jgi:hypothetical protein